LGVPYPPRVHHPPNGTVTVDTIRPSRGRAMHGGSRVVNAVAKPRVRTATKGI